LGLGPTGKYLVVQGVDEEVRLERNGAVKFHPRAGKIQQTEESDMADPEDIEARHTYLDLMVEAKARILGINTLIQDQRGIPSPLVREYGVLQIRMLCEIIGLGCLVAHGDLVAKASTKLKKAYSPDEIFAALDKLHDDFFPMPIRPEKTDTGWHMAEYTSGSYARKKRSSKFGAVAAIFSTAETSNGSSKRRVRFKRISMISATGA